MRDQHKHLKDDFFDLLDFLADRVIFVSVLEGRFGGVQDFAEECDVRINLEVGRVEGVLVLNQVVESFGDLKHIFEAMQGESAAELSV